MNKIIAISLIVFYSLILGGVIRAYFDRKYGEKQRRKDNMRIFIITLLLVYLSLISGCATTAGNGNRSTASHDLEMMRCRMMSFER